MVYSNLYANINNINDKRSGDIAFFYIPKTCMILLTVVCLFFLSLFTCSTEHHPTNHSTRSTRYLHDDASTQLHIRSHCCTATVRTHSRVTRCTWANRSPSRHPAGDDYNDNWSRRAAGPTSTADTGRNCCSPRRAHRHRSGTERPP